LASKVYTNLVLGGKLRGLEEDNTCGGRTIEFQGDVKNIKGRKNGRGDPVKEFCRPSWGGNDTRLRNTCLKNQNPYTQIHTIPSATLRIKPKHISFCK
jgi:hypothetical protein